MHSEASIRYQKKIMKKAHVIKVSDVCDTHKCDDIHPEHPESDEEDKEVHPDIETHINKTFYFHHWHRRIYEQEQKIGDGARYRMMIDDE
jgi:hypothetical protein